MKGNTTVGVSNRRNRRTKFIEPLENRAYLAGVVFGSPQNTNPAPLNLAPIYANLDNIFSTTHADLIVASKATGSIPDSVSVLPGNGDGTFATPHTVNLTFHPLTIIDGQFGTNGKMGIAVGSSNNNTLGVILQDSGGNLSETDYTATGLTNTQNVTVGDFNGDSHPDIAVSSYDSIVGNNVAIFFNNGDGTFTDHQTLSVPHAHVSSLTAFNAGGHVQLAVCNQDANTVTVILNDTNGNFSIGPDYNVGAGPVTIKAGQFNSNNNTNDDLVTANSTGGSVSVLLGNGDGTFNPTAKNTNVQGLPGGASGPLKVRVSNVTNSGKPDLLALLPPGSSGDAEVLLGNGDGTFHVGNILSTGGSNRAGIAGGDLNGDNLTDVVVVDPTQITALINETNQDTSTPTGSVDTSQPAQVSGSPTITFNVTFTDSRQIDTTSLNGNNITVVDPSGATRNATLVSTPPANAPSVGVTYSIPATGGSLATGDEGTYHVIATNNSGNAVKNANEIPVAAGEFGTFTVHVVSNASGANLTAVSLTGKLPTAVVAGNKNKGGVTVLVKNSGTDTATGSMVVDLYASPTSTLGNNAVKLTSVTKKVKLKAGKSMKVNFRSFKWDASLDGSFFLVANVNATNTVPESSAADNTAASGAAITVKAPFVDLANLWDGTLPSITTGKKVTLTVPTKENGNIAAKGTATYTIQAVGATSTTVATVPVKVNIAPGKTAKVRVPFTIASLASGTYSLTVTLSFAGDTDASNDAVTSTSTFTV